MAIIRYANDSYLDVESIQFITGNYESPKQEKWNTNIVIGGVPIQIQGQPGKNIMDAYIWQWKHSIVDMIPGKMQKQKLFK